MKIAAIAPQESLAQFVDRVFAGATDAQKKQALEKVRAANPHLADTPGTARAAGTPVLVPDLPDIKRTAVADSTDPVQFLVVQARAQLASIGDALAPGFDRQSEALRQTLALANSPDIRKVIGQIPDLNKRVADIVKATQTDLDTTERLRVVQKESFAELDDDLNRFVGGKPNGAT
jgi:hypothetical protein